MDKSPTSSGFTVENTQAQGGHSYVQQQLEEFGRKQKMKTRSDTPSVFTNDSNFSKRSELRRKFKNSTRNLISKVAKPFRKGRKQESEIVEEDWFMCFNFVVQT